MTKIESATLAGGCFWCIESAFSNVDGIESAYCGYAGGHVNNPTYEAVCSGTTGHAEVVQVNFDTTKITYRDVLEILFALHDPTQLNRQGNDVGSQYRSAIFYHNEEQKYAANSIIEEMTQNNVWPAPIVTEVVELANYSEAESHHQDYFNNNPQNRYCAMVVAPKLAKFKKNFASRLKSA